jgi:hypothetical protein
MLKQHFFLTTIFFILSFTSSAQTGEDKDKEEKIQLVGLKIGANVVNWQTNSDSIQFSGSTGLNAGFVMSAQIKNKFYIHSEICYSQKNTTIHVSKSNILPDGKYAYKVNSIDWLVLPSLHFHKRFFIEAGPWIYAIFTTRSKDDLINNSEFNALDKSLSGSIHYGFGAGIGSYITDKLYLNVRYQYTLSNFYKPQELTANSLPSNLKANVSMVQFSAVLLIPGMYFTKIKRRLI